MGTGSTIIAAALTLMGLAACREKQTGQVVREPLVTTPTPSRSDGGSGGIETSVALAKTPDPTPVPPPPASVERLPVPGDIAASVVRSLGGSAPLTVFVPGVCSNGGAYLHTFPEAARQQGGVVAIEGDLACGPPGFRTFSWDIGRLHARIGTALVAAGLAEVPPEGITLVGYSQGAALGEQMVKRWPERYARVVLIGAPIDPSPKNFDRARALVTMSCDRDVPSRMKQAARAATKAGIPATYIEMPGCTHGNITEGERVFGSVFDWLRTNERAVDTQTSAPLTAR